MAGKRIKFHGRTYTFQQLGQAYGVHPATIRERYQRGVRGDKLVQGTDSPRSLYEAIAQQSPVVQDTDEIPGALRKVLDKEGFKLLSYLTNKIGLDDSPRTVYRCTILEIVHLFNWNDTKASRDKAAHLIENTLGDANIYLKTDSGTTITAMKVMAYLRYEGHDPQRGYHISFRFNDYSYPYLKDLARRNRFGHALKGPRSNPNEISHNRR